MGGVTLFTTSTAATLQLKSDIMRLKALLDAKKISYEEVHMGLQHGRL